MFRLTHALAAFGLALVLTTAAAAERDVPRQTTGFVSMGNRALDDMNDIETVILLGSSAAAMFAAVLLLIARTAAAKRSAKALDRLDTWVEDRDA